VTHLHAGPVNAEVILTLPGGKSICAVVTRDSANRLELTPGTPVCAVIEASAVILCV
jgi:molybdate transport system regulatory protein